MTLNEAIIARHSVRQYMDKKIEPEKAKQLNDLINDCNKNSGLNIQLCLDEPTAFTGIMAKYGKFTNVKNYIALVGNKNEALDEKCGYYGEKIVIKAMELGLSTCWVAATYKKNSCKALAKNNEKIYCVIAIGYGETNGVERKSKSFSEVTDSDKNYPEWFKTGVDFALKAPTAMNQQKFMFTLIDNNTVKLVAKSGFYSKIDLGIVKYHFEVGADGSNFKWA